MGQIIDSALGSVIGAVIISLFGIGGSTIVINSVTGSGNPRKKWRILMVMSVIAFIIAGISMTTYAGGFSYYSESEQTVLWLCTLTFIIGWIGNWINK